jgi:hypothetical protein
MHARTYSHAVLISHLISVSSSGALLWQASGVGVGDRSRILSAFELAGDFHIVIVFEDFVAGGANVVVTADFASKSGSQVGSIASNSHSFYLRSLPYLALPGRFDQARFRQSYCFPCLCYQSLTLVRLPF